MKVLLICGDQPRHRYLARSLHGAGYLSSLIIQAREPFVPDPPEDLSRSLSDLWYLHFQKRARAEEEFFGDVSFPHATSVRHTYCTAETLHNDYVVSEVRRTDADLALTYGVGYIHDPLMSTLPRTWNVHAGLSPKYRGAITHFWPSYLLEPNWTGVTLHDLTPELDGGGVVHQTGAALQRGDGLHDLSCRTVRWFVDELVELLSADDWFAPVQQERTGKVWRKADWRPEHLAWIYGVWEDRIVDAYLDGEFTAPDPELVRQPHVEEAEKRLKEEVVV